MENAFGLLTAVWRVFTNAIGIKVENVSKIVFVTCVLHNLLRAKKQMFETVDREDTANGRVQTGSWRDVRNKLSDVQQISNFSSASANSIRETYCEYFNTTGKVDWQDKFINHY